MLTLTFMSLGAVEPQISRNLSDGARARQLAESGIEWGFNQLAGKDFNDATLLGSGTTTGGVNCGSGITCKVLVDRPGASGPDHHRRDLHGHAAERSQHAQHGPGAHRERQYPRHQRHGGQQQDRDPEVDRHLQWGQPDDHRGGPARQPADQRGGEPARCPGRHVFEHAALRDQRRLLLGRRTRLEGRRYVGASANPTGSRRAEVRDDRRHATRSRPRPRSGFNTLAKREYLHGLTDGDGDGYGAATDGATLTGATGNGRNSHRERQHPHPWP